MSVFSCPMDCLPGVAEVWGGQYGGLGFAPGLRVLDIGANCGAFAAWAAVTWKPRLVTCFEPNPELWPFLGSNTKALPCSVEVVGAAVGDPALTELRRGVNPLNGSMYDLGAGFQTGERMPMAVVHPTQLPMAEVWKLDCEGAEAYIVEHRVYTPMVIVAELHGAALERRFEAALKGAMERVPGRAKSIQVWVNISSGLRKIG